MSFETNPLNDDLVALSEYECNCSFNQKYCIYTAGEKFFNPDFGSRISESLFENVDDVSALAIEG